MMPFYPKKILSSISNLVLPPKSTNVAKYLPLAIGIIILVGSIVATGCLYAPIGNWSLIIGGGGLMVALALAAIGLSYNCNLNYGNSNSEVSLKRYHQSVENIVNPQCRRVPMRADDIQISGTLPQPIPSDYNISGKKWLGGTHLCGYIIYLHLNNPNLLYLDAEQEAYRSEDHSINKLHEYLFDYLQLENLNSFNIPIYLKVGDNHWTLVYIDREKRTVEYYDSLKNYGNHDEIVEQLTKIAAELSQRDKNAQPYKFVCKINKKLQLDSYQCGPWVLYFLEMRLLNPEFDFNQLDIKDAQELIKKYRIQIMLTLIQHQENILKLRLPLS